MGPAAATMPGMEYRVVNPAEWIERAMPLLRTNWAETGFDFGFAPDVAAYQRLHDAGLVFAMVALDGVEVEGYCSVTVVPHPHNPAVTVASNDALFVAPRWRSTLLPGRLIRLAEQEAAARGARRFTWHCRAGTPLAAMLARHGYQPVDQVVMKEI